VPRPL